MAQALDLWVESVHRYHERAAEARRWEMVRFHDHMSRLHGQLAAEHQEKAEALMDPPARDAHACRDGSGPYPQTPGEEREQTVARMLRGSGEEGRQGCDRAVVIQCSKQDL